MEEFYINDDSIKLHVKLDKPTNTPCPLVILIPGLHGDMEEQLLTTTVETLNNKQYAVLRVELYGHGKSQGTYKEHTLYKWITNTLKVIEYAKTIPWKTDIYLSGHSQAGLITILAAAMCQDDIKAIIPLAPAITIPEDARKGKVLNTTFDQNHIPDTLLFDNEAISGNYFRTAQTIHIEDALEKYNKPIYIFQGSEDELIPIQTIQELASRYHNIHLTIIQDDNHCFDYHLDTYAKELQKIL